MADVKISGLPASTVPLAGTEVLPIVQGGATKQVSIANVTAGRAVSAASLALTTTPLPVTSGGTGTATAFTTGSILFTGASGVYSQSNTDFFWDNTNKRLGLGTTAPDSFVDIYSPTQGYAGIGIKGYAGAVKWYVNAGVSGTSINIFNIGNNANGTSPYVAISPVGGVSIGDLTDPGAGNLRLGTGNLVIGTSGKGIDFSATPGTGTSELLADYEEGTFTPTANNFTVVGTPTYTGRYTKIGRVVFINIQASSTTSIASIVGSSNFSGLPFSAIQDSSAPAADSNSAASYGNGIVAGNILYAPTWSASGSVALSAMFQTA